MLWMDGYGNRESTWAWMGQKCVPQVEKDGEKKFCACDRGFLYLTQTTSNRQSSGGVLESRTCGRIALRQPTWFL